MDRVGLIQMTSSSEPAQNLAYIEQQVSLLVAQGAKWIVTPENALVFGTRQQYHQHAEPLGQGPLQSQLAAMALFHRVWLLVGSMPIRREVGVTTTSLLFDASGDLVAYYDKLHMFDADVADGHQRYRESETFTCGTKLSVASTPFGQIGLSICYDVRFPHLYSQLRMQGAQILVVPAAFTAVTGKAHWEVLLRARAIDNQCWIVAVGQTGLHPCGRETWGHSMVISPWGEVIASLNQQVGNLVADIDLVYVEQVRQKMPIAAHTRFTNQFIDNKSKL
ncbi:MULTISPECIES: carbon-nitrogen hydrolase family protein [unclassified Vibrio]|uniref:carbon-nitrogen hydrolase family protein n=1 Tax=unclassified Vibrio TaxID=2614977 RepID=UPI0014825BB7|nr:MULTISPECIES: carbon-nitrogen hydrolase family protein [unclassified Vibrio]MDQ2192574.1 carbon-nitrogen hydrolase family protein [Vibrio sp. A14(2019)]MDQ2196198.1 carbon-nitrogen hydrolase family protein [Vibrio sp. 2017_1457_11]NNN74936.1 carbon-nitrogen hydrolase family protein [Vibrio sp. B7]NNN91939.1 carbon-nitrogen hydrolase family protein [Vibrio sp. B8-1]NNO07239.1 carbon-nitrogen hydrolase family protein [Vibrio sp. B4-12]